VILTVMTMKMCLEDAMSCSLVVFQPFWETCCLHLQGRVLEGHLDGWLLRNNICKWILIFAYCFTLSVGPGIYPFMILRDFLHKKHSALLSPCHFDIEGGGIGFLWNICTRMHFHKIPAPMIKTNITETN